MLDVTAVEGTDGHWRCRVAYEEHPDYVIEDRSTLDALDRLEDLRVRTITRLLDEDLIVPTARPPLTA